MNAFRFCLLTVVGFVLVVVSSPRVAAEDALQQAEKKFQTGDLLGAEKLYRDALSTSNGDLRRRCYDRLLVIYVRLGRHDQAIQSGLRYQQWLREQKETQRLRELDLQLGESYLALGH